MSVNVDGARQTLIETKQARIDELELAVFDRNIDIGFNLKRIEELEGYERMCKMSGQNIGLRLLNAEETITELQAVVDRLADKDVYFIDDERCKSFEEWVSREYCARIRYAAKHATEKS